MSCMLVISPVTSMTAQAACSHSWSAYSFYDMWYEHSSGFGKCLIRVTKSVKTCSKCGDVGFKEVRKQLTHSFGSNGMCSNGCGNGYAR